MAWQMRLGLLVREVGGMGQSGQIAYWQLKRAGKMIRAN